MTRSDRTAVSSWWGKFELAPEEFGRWRIGPLDLWIRRTTLDWRYGARQTGDPVDSSLEVSVPAPEPQEEEDFPEELGRFGFEATGSTLELLPALADRPVVARPSACFFVAAGEQVELFISSPAWVQMRAKRSLLTELCCTRPSDTWFGRNTQGELAYSSRTVLRRRLSDLPIRPHRIVSCVRVENTLDTTLAIERLSLPVPQLSVFASESGTLWTEVVKVKHEDEGGLAEVTLGKGPPQLIGKTKLLAKARAPKDRRFASLVLGGLFESSY